MTRDEARVALAENLIMLAEALLDDKKAGEYKSDLEKGELKITSCVGKTTTVIAIKKWDYAMEDDEWDDIIE